MNFRIIVFLFFFGSQSVIAQQADSLRPEPKQAKNQFLKGAIVPAALLGLGFYTMQGNGVYSSFDAQYDVQKTFPGFRTNADDFVFFVPVVGLYAFNAFSSQNKNRTSRQTMLLLSSATLMGAIVYPMKNFSYIWRPDDSNDHSFPSGHTSTAFVVAAVADREFRDKSRWISVGSYTIASATGVLRVLNNKHWISDVFAGAGIGLISVHSVYYVHDKWLKNKNVSLVPTSMFGGKGFTFSATF